LPPGRLPAALRAPAWPHALSLAPTWPACGAWCARSVLQPEIVAKCSNPSFKKATLVDFFFEEVQYVRFQVRCVL
jgi:hypothetical protein